MSRISRIEVAQKMEGSGMIPLFYHSDLDTCVKTLEACYAGGARLIEFTARGNFAFEIFGKLITFAKTHLPDMILGVGSITDAGASSLYMQSGADFIVTPTLRKDIAISCNRRKVLWLPGCASLTEINHAEELGCEIIKLFPGSVYGPGFIKAIKGPQPWTKIMPTGGVNLESSNLKAWFEAGATCVGIGSKLISKSIMEHRQFEELRDNVRKTLKTISSIKQDLL